MVAWHEKYMCKWVKEVGIDTPSGEKPGIWFRHETVDESLKKMLYRCAASCDENLEIRDNKCITHSTW